MEKIMISKKFKFLIPAVLGFFLAPTFLAAGDTSPRKASPLPVLHYAGVIPVQWEKDEVWQDLGHVQKSIDSEFSGAVHDSKRFIIVNDELVKSLWKTPAGRKELETDYELSAFANLDVSARGDMVVLTTRLLSPRLETRLQESDVIKRKWLVEASKDQTSAKLRDLVQRMINRLPLDAHITSVNGSYLTISAGTEQGIKSGEKFDVLSAAVESLHPANGSWLSFGTAKTGTAEIIEVKSQSSIAKITSLSYENAIKPGDGIRIDDISSRSRFARAEEAQTMASASDQGSAIIEPAGSKPAISHTIPAQLPAEKTVATDVPAKAEEHSPSETAVAEAPKDAPPATDDFTAKIMPKGSEMRTYLGLKMWSISGSSSADASLPVWLVNSAGADIFRKFSDTIDFNYGLDLGYGPTGKGSFFGYNLHSGARWHMYLKDILPGADDVYFGLLAGMASYSISGETSGGYDTTMIRLTAGVHGWARPDFIGEKIEWTGEFFYPLYYSGQFGVKGKYKDIQSGSSLAFRVGGYFGSRTPETWQYGAAFDYESSSWALTNGKSADVGSMGLLALARRNL